MKKRELETLIKALLEKYDTINLSQILKEAGFAILPKNQRMIQRTLASLIQQGVVEVQGAARSRAYIRKKEQPNHTTQGETIFKSLPLSEKSKALLSYLSKSVQMRQPVGYDQSFLRSYQPNITQYLSTSLQQELALIGGSESVVRPAGTYARKIFNRLLIDLSWNSSRLEGNTYSLLETKRLIELGENATGKDAIESQMILNHKEAIEYMIESAQEANMSTHDIYSIHALLSDNLLGDPSASGRLRQIAVGISGTSYFPLENPHIIRECFELFIKKINLITDPFEQSFFSLVHLSYLQAFEDVNKRTARLVANFPLIKKNLKPLSFVDVNQQDYAKSLLGIYEKNDVSLLRDLYLWAYQRSAQQYSALQQAMGEPNLFKLKYRTIIQDIVRKIIIEKVSGDKIIAHIKHLVHTLNLPESDSVPLFQMIESEIVNLHQGNIARFKIKPREFDLWKNLPPNISS